MLEFLGRADAQMKLRGFRIETGEIEATLLQQGSVAQAAVTARENATGKKQLIAYVVGASDQAVDTVALRKHLERSLPNFMVPSAFVVVEAMPLTPNGKIDRNALPAPGSLEFGESFVAPRSPTELRLARICCGILDLRAVGIHDDFFELGGFSILVLRLISEINRVLKVGVSVADVYKNSTLERMTRLIIAQSLLRSQRPAVTQLKSGSSDLPVYFIYAGSHQFNLARMMGESPVFGIEIPWSLARRNAVVANRRSEFPSMEQLVAPYVSALSAHAGTSPCVLAGYSFSGLMAFEAAHQFKRKGGKVELVMLFDCQGIRPIGFRVLWRKLRIVWKQTPNGHMDRHPQLIAFRLKNYWGLISRLLKRAANRSGSFFGRPEPKSVITAVPDEEGLFVEWELLDRLYGEISKSHRPRRQVGREILIRVDPRDGKDAVRTNDESLGWKNMFTEELEIIPVIGDHLL